MRKFVFLFLLWFAGWSGTATATLINGGLETGTFQGWTPSVSFPQASVITEFPPPSTVIPPPSPLLDPAILVPFVPSGTFPLVQPVGHPVNNYFGALRTSRLEGPDEVTEPVLVDDSASHPTLHQSVANVRAGDTLSGYMSFFSMEPVPPTGIDPIGNVDPLQDDTFYVSITDAGGEVMRQELSVSGSDEAGDHELWGRFDMTQNGDLEDVYMDPSPDDMDTILDTGGFVYSTLWYGYVDSAAAAQGLAAPTTLIRFLFRWTDWAPWTWTAAADGDYTISFGMINYEMFTPDPLGVGRGTSDLFSVGFFDEVKHRPIPEPTTVLLLGSGLVFGALQSRHRRKRS